MRNTFLLPEIRELIATENRQELQAFLEDLHPAVASEFLNELEVSEILVIFNWLDAPLAAGIFAHLDVAKQIAIAKFARPSEIGRILELMPPDDRADLFNEMSEHQQEKILPTLSSVERADVEKLSSYREGSAGAVMTSDYVTLRPSASAAEAIETLRYEAPRRETIYYAYCIDESRRLIGFVSLKDIILASPAQKIVEFMHTEVLSVNVSTDQEEVAQIIQKYDLIAIPVTDEAGILVGIITHDDAIDIMTEEHTEDIEKLMAIAGTHEAGAYLKTPSLVHFRNRVGWLVGLSIAGMVSGMIIHSFEANIQRLMILALYMPMIADSGGNAGSQASTVVIRAIALKELVPGDIGKVISKEIKISVMLACVLGLLAWGKVLFLSAGSDIPAGFSLYSIAMVIGLSLSLQVVSSAVIGVILPLAAARLEMDPALIASPALTTIVDITGLLIYFSTATYLLGL
ncbi:MAG TPA: magnesium transporter [Candidatus Riflebacteria bacterium]|nr:magnesium transporter [Candidatus Riflebacteria bacterium]